MLKARRTSSTVVVNTVASENPDAAGRYSMDVEHGQYSVTLLVAGFPPSHAGTITVYEGDVYKRQEFVFTKEATSRIGVGNLYRLMRGCLLYTSRCV